MEIRVQGISTRRFEAFRRGEPDANGQTAVRRVAEGAANPCRHCLELIAEGEGKLVLAYRPFDRPQPYAEIGPIFLHASNCTHYSRGGLPGWFVFLEPAMIRGYDAEDWIRYDTGEVVSGAALDAKCREILADPSIAYVHIRSKFGCFQCRVDRA